MRIFVYGSLRHKQGNSHWMTNAQLLGDFSIDNYQLYSLGHYPAQFRGTEQYTVKFIVLTTPRWPNLMPCAPGAVNTRAS
ncbi:AIG2 family protein [Escherichia coli]|uniref:AIG2 family protein n=1 Tax=Escherichia coli TaxID=562 RepID=A0A2X3KGJ5_ECOLX|nr:AIG2 family protein [Escherichia coli]